MAIQSRKFLAENHLTIEKVEGPPSGQSTTVVVHYQFETSQPELSHETSETRAIRLAREAAGLLQPVVEKFGGAAELLQWIRSEDAA